MGEIGYPQRRIEVVPETQPVREAPSKPATPAPAPQKAPEREPVPV